MGIVVKIGGVDKSSLIVADSVAWSRRLNGSGDASFVVDDTSYRPVAGSPVEIVEDGSVAWGGLISQLSEIAVFDTDQLNFRVRIACVTWDAILRRRVIPAEVFTSIDAGNIIIDLHTAYLAADGITLGTIDSGVHIDRYNIDHLDVETISQELARLSDKASYIDENRVLHFRDPQVTTAPWTIADGASHVTSIEIERTDTDHANAIYRKLAPEAFVSVVEDFTMTASPRVWDLTDYAATVTNIQVDTGSGFEARTFGLDGVESARDYYWQVGSSAILADAAQTETGTLRVTYRPFGSNVVISVDAVDIAARAAIEGTSGRHERVVDDSSSVDAVFAQDANDAELALAVVVPEIIRATTVDTHPRPGMVVTIALTTPAITGDYIIQEVQARAVGDDTQEFQYSYVAANVSRVGGWQEWLKSLKGQFGTGSGAGAGAATTGGSGGSSGAVLPGDFTIGTVTFRWVPQGDGVRAEVLIPVTPPTPIGTTEGGHIYVELEDQSVSPRFAIGTSGLGGSAGAVGVWDIRDKGRLPYVATEQPWVIQLPEISLRRTTAVRIYVEPYSKDIDAAPIRDGETDETPNAAVTITPYQSGKPSSGVDITTSQILSVVATADTPVTVSGRLLRPISVTVTLPSNPPDNWAYQLIGYVDGDLDSSPVLGTGILSRDVPTDPVPAGEDGITTAHTFGNEEPSEIQHIVIYAVSGLIMPKPVPRGFVPGPPEFVPNNIVSGITASDDVTIGTVTGVLDPTQNIQALLNPTVAVLNGLFGVKPSGISDQELQDAAVKLAKLADLAVSTAKVIDLAVSTPKMADLAATAAKLGNSSVTATKIDNLAVGTAAIAALAVTTAKIDNLAVTTALIDNLQVSTAKIQLVAITTALIADLAVQTAKIANLAVTDAKIDTISASKITAGTITATVSMTSPVLVITSGTITVNIDSTNFIKVTNSSSATFSEHTWSHFLISKSGVNVTSLQGGVLELRNNSGTAQINVGPTSISFDGTQVMGPRQTGLGSPTGWADATALSWAQALYTRLSTLGCVT